MRQRNKNIIRTYDAKSSACGICGNKTQTLKKRVDVAIYLYSANPGYYHYGNICMKCYSERIGFVSDNQGVDRCYICEQPYHAFSKIMDILFHKLWEYSFHVDCFEEESGLTIKQYRSRKK